MSGQPGLFDLTGRVALVTGASSGLGRHFAGVLARAGASVVVAARRREALDDLVDELEAAGHRAMAVTLDVTRAEDVEAGFARAGAALGSVDILINNSGVAPAAAAVDLAEADWDRALDTNLKGAFLTAQAFARRAIAAKHGGAIVNIASILGFRVAGHVAAYAASKAGLVQLTQALALEWARHGIRVNAIAPGYVATEMTAGLFDGPGGQAMLGRVPQRRIGQPEDLDGALLLLAGDGSRYMTGSTVTVDGGHLVSSL
ncbi:MAG TPA: glucose 1-dehydrogenase [Lichenihabitans sp.]|jgi:NAD(P)-dependent dehydrogenase (short-subunit alcohol dehydrogenase family)|nr:glucose 1-dehydrogenase [Lichenihabitans sp.]